MKIITYFYKKFFQSFVTCLVSITLIFYIFSLIGNLSEKLSFQSILYLSLLNSLQIISYVPSIIVLLSIILVVIFLRSKNELMIIKEYLSMNKLVIIFIPIVFCFTLIEINKNKLSKEIENTKLNFLKSYEQLSSKVIIYKNNDYKSYIILNDIDVLSSKHVGEYQKYEIKNDKIIRGEYSDQITFKNNSLITNNFTKFEDNKIKKINDEKTILPNINKIINNDFILKDEFKSSIYKVNADRVIKFIYFIIFYECLFLILFNKKIIDRKEKLFFSLLLSTILIFYSIIIYNVNLKIYYLEQQFLALILILFIFYKFYRYE